MATIKAVREGIVRLLANGILEPRSWGGQSGDMMMALVEQDWMRTFNESPDVHVHTTISMYLDTAPDQYWPAPARLRRIVDVVVDREAGRQALDADAAWGLVLRSFRRHSDQPSALHDDPQHHEAIMAGLAACGGWATVRRGDREAAVAASFRRAFDAHRQHLAEERGIQRAIGSAIPKRIAPADCRVGGLSRGGGR